MYKRSSLYWMSLIFVTLFTLIPQGYLVFSIGRLVYLMGHVPLLYPAIPGINVSNHSYSDFSHANMWRGMFVQVIPDIERIRAQRSSRMAVVNDYILTFTDPLTGNKIGQVFPLKSGVYRPIVLGDRLFLVGNGAAANVVTQSYEFIENELMPFEFMWPQYDPMTLVEGKLTRIQVSGVASVPVVTTVESGKWTLPREVVIPQSIKYFDTGANLNRPENSSVVCLNDGEKIYTFVRSEGKVYFRPGLPLRSLEHPDQIQTYGAQESGPTEEGDSDAKWQLVQTKSKAIPVSNSSAFAIVEGRPTALLVDGKLHLPVGRLYQFDGTDWSELTEFRFPIGSQSFRLLSVGNRLPPYIVATTSTGTSFVYRWESGELVEVPGQGPELTWTFVKRDIRHHLSQYATVLGLGVLPCLAIWLLSQLCTSSDYSFGDQTVTLASLGRRGVAKVLDLSLLAIVSVCVAIIMLSKVSWFEVAESLHLKLDHSDIPKIIQTLYVEVIILGVAILFLVVVQGICGATPGKWLCGLRTLRTTLRSCGIARSVVRELLLAVDSTYLMWWIPGSMMIGVTERRQRIGDLLGDTVVVTSRSLKSSQQQKSESSEYLV